MEGGKNDKTKAKEKSNSKKENKKERKHFWEINKPNKGRQLLAGQAPGGAVSRLS